MVRCLRQNQYNPNRWNRDGTAFFTRSGCTRCVRECFHVVCSLSTQPFAAFTEVTGSVVQFWCGDKWVSGATSYGRLLRKGTGKQRLARELVFDSSPHIPSLALPQQIANLSGRCDDVVGTTAGAEQAGRAGMLLMLLTQRTDRPVPQKKQGIAPVPQKK